MELFYLLNFSQHLRIERTTMWSNLSSFKSTVFHPRVKLQYQVLLKYHKILFRYGLSDIFSLYIYAELEI